ncbi:molecular chaperone DnaJ [Cylindrospermum sp. FACHB-282]|uniref:molecular chaperone DnaJ n=1 Tax=Cylindrospermum sp. FACHB-282 TaxID=2692794 RepID=UPI001681FCE7|nr:molecular chaperone DnaJ [Cylindrospermum sp. FACHB-282]MBD2386405.1 molecular chaperone DnaJ [Cylindrospermum sp. FACHB-282]
MENNPYDILGVSPAASKAEITKALATAMKRKQYPVAVIAKAQKSLMKPEERIIADYLRPILPPIKQLQYSDLSKLDQPAPTLVLLPEFDGLEQAMAQAIQEEHLEGEYLAMPLSALFTEGITACQEGRYPKAIKYLEDYCQGCTERHSQEYIKATIWLIKAYKMGGQRQRAIALCQLLTSHDHPQVQTWAKNNLPLLSKEISRA